METVEYQVPNDIHVSSCGITYLKYLLRLPINFSGEVCKVPLVLFLHGATARGSDLDSGTIKLKHCDVNDISSSCMSIVAKIVLSRFKRR
jgi:hypothetical protein